jgi:5-methylcytosine-specific restriction protein A
VVTPTVAPTPFGMKLYSCRECGAIGPARYCEAHGPRGNFRERGYGRYFEAQRAIRLRLNPTCCEPDCDKPATVADHIIRKRDGGSDHHDNLRSMCRSCHSRHTALGG